MADLKAKFLSTPSVGRATRPTSAGNPYMVISIHALRGEGDLDAKHFDRALIISIHALRGEGDPLSLPKKSSSY